MPQIKVKKLKAEAIIPTQGTESAAGFDLYALKAARVPGRGVEKVSTGISLEIPDDYFVKIEERSGISVRTPLGVKAGIIDPDYRGEIIIVFQNISAYPYDIEAGDKVAQFTVHKRYKTSLKVIDEFETPDTERGEAGFGSTDSK